MMAAPNKFNVSGLSVEDIRGLNTRRLSDSALRAVTTRLVSAANKRLKRLEQTEGWESSIFASAHGGSGFRFSTKGISSRGSLFALFNRLRDFLDPSKKSHTVRGWKSEWGKLKESLGDAAPVLSDRGFWSMFRKFLKQGTGFDSFSLRHIIAEAWNEGIREEDEMAERLRERYEQGEEEDEESGNWIDFDSEDWGDEF